MINKEVSIFPWYRYICYLPRKIHILFEFLAKSQYWHLKKERRRFFLHMPQFRKHKKTRTLGTSRSITADMQETQPMVYFTLLYGLTISDVIANFKGVFSTLILLSVRSKT